MESHTPCRSPDSSAASCRSATDRRGRLCRVVRLPRSSGGARDEARAVEAGGEGAVEDRVDERGLARTGHARHGDEAAEREFDRHIAEVVLLRALDREDALRINGAALFGMRIARRPAK